MRAGIGSALVDLELTIVHATEKAVKVENENGTEAWLPLSAVDLDGDGEPDPRPVTITMPLRLAEEKGLA